MLRGTSRAIRPAAGIRFRRHQEGSALVVILVIVLVVLVVVVGALFAGTGPGPVQFIVYDGSVTAPASFPTILDDNTPTVSVTYAVTTKRITVPYGAGPGFPPSSQTAPVPVENAVVVFTLANGDATFADGSTSKSVTTLPGGVANVTIKRARDGDDTLTFVMKITTGSLWWKKTHTIPDTDSFSFEVEMP